MCCGASLHSNRFTAEPELDKIKPLPPFMHSSGKHLISKYFSGEIQLVAFWQGSVAMWLCVKKGKKLKIVQVLRSHSGDRLTNLTGQAMSDKRSEKPNLYPSLLFYRGW